MEYVNTNLDNVFSVDDLIRELNARQLVLKSGENIKTIDGQSVLGSGNLEVATLHNQELVVKFPIGALWPGYTFAQGTTLEEILRKLLAGPGSIDTLKGITFEEIVDNTHESEVNN